MTAGGDGNGFTPAPQDLTDAEMIEALELGHTFPGFFPIVVIAKEGPEFKARLEAAVGQAQGEAPYRVTERPSSEGSYVSYRLELYVDSARQALDRKRVVAELDGVIFLL